MVPVNYVLGLPGLVVLGQRQKPVAEAGITPSQAVWPVPGTGMVVQVAPQPGATFQVAVGVVECYGHDRSFRL